MDNRFHVLLVSKSTGGSGQYLRSLVYGINKDRFKVTVVCLSDGSEKLAAELSQIDGVKALSYTMERYRINLFTDVPVWLKLTRLIRQEKFDLVHAFASKAGLIARMAAAGSDTSVIYCPLCFSFHDRALKWKVIVYSAIERIMAAWFTNRIVCLCNDERSLALRYGVGSEEKLLTIYSGIEESQFNVKVDQRAIRESLGIPEFAFLVGTIGRMCKQKAPADFVNAAALVHREYPQVHFIWVGDGELMKKTQSLAHSLGIEQVIHLLSYREDISYLLQVMDCFVLTSHWESFSQSVLEAMAAGLPVIMSRVYGAMEAVAEGETGRLIPIGDLNGFAMAIIHMVSHTELAKSFGEAGKLRVKKLFPLKHMINTVEDLYIELTTQGTVKKAKF